MAKDEESSGIDEWEADYQQLLEDAQKKGEIEILPDKSEQRKYPRIRMITRSIQVHDPQHYEILDMSIGGMSFYSDLPFEEEKVITISLEGLLTIEARVIKCSMEETDPMFLEVRYKIHCKFEDERYGMRLMVLALQSEGSSIGISA